MSLIQQFNQYIQQQDLFHPKDHLLLAVSGGVDSVVLCDLCKKAGYRFMIAHCNFQLRGEESERDENFVRELALGYEVRLYVERFPTENYAAINKLGIQEAARDLRYGWFKMILSDLTTNKRPRYLLTAHHADDNIETVLMNFTRGTGLQGLGGIQPKQEQIRRPLLQIWKDELIAYAAENNLNFVEDSSNKSSKYTRNLFRNEIIPLIGQAYPQVKSNLLDNVGRFNEIHKLYRLSLENLKKKLCKVKNDEIHIPVKQLLDYNNKALIYEVIADYGFSESQVEEVIKLSQSDSGRMIYSRKGDHRLIKFRNWFIISTKTEQEREPIVIDDGVRETVINQPGLTRFRVEKLGITVGFQPPKSQAIACLDAAGINFPLILRRWKQGDYFYPLGMRKKKKLARFFIDQKLSKTERERVWVVEMNKKLIWILGHRIDDRFKITEKTISILKLSLETS